MHRKKSFAERSKILLDIDQKSNFVELSKYKTLKLIIRISTFLAALLIIFKSQQNYFV